MFVFKSKILTLLLMCSSAFGQLDSSVSITNHRQISISQENAWIDKDGDTKLNTLGVGAAPVTNSMLDVTGSLSLKEQATADTETTDWGQIWVKNTSPTELWYTDDLGTDLQLSGVGAAVSGSGTTNTIPIWTGVTTLGDSGIAGVGNITLTGNLLAVGKNIRLVDSQMTGLFIRVENTDSDNDTADAFLSARTTGSGGGDAFMHWEAGFLPSIFVLGIDNSNSDKFVGSVGDTLGTVNWLEVGPSGAVILGDEIFVTTDKVSLGVADVTNTFLTIEGAISLKEQAAADTFTAAYGQLWVKDDDPNTLWFTNDNTTDYQLGGGAQAFTTLVTSGDVGLGGAITTNSLVSIGGTISLLEQTDADADTVNYGQIWVKDTSPNELWFTDDNGSDFILGGILGADITGSGTAQKLAVFAGTQTISDSIIAQVSNDIGVNTVLPVSGFDIRDATVTLSTSDDDIIATDILGQIDFRAPDEASGTDALLAGASIWAEASATFSAAVNNTDLIFATAESETAVEKMRLTSTGFLGIGTDNPSQSLDVIGLLRVGTIGDVISPNLNSNELEVQDTVSWAGMALLSDTGGIIDFGDSADDNAGRLSYTHAGDLMQFTTTGNVTRLNLAALAAVFNETGVDTDFRVEGVGEANALFVQGSNGFVGIGIDTPSEKLHGNMINSPFILVLQRTDASIVDGNVLGALEIHAGEGDPTATTGKMEFEADETWDGSTSGTRFLIGLTSPGSLSSEEVFRIDSLGKVGIKAPAPTGQFHVDQTSTTAAIPTAVFDQADISEGFINFMGSDRGSVSGSVASVRVEINGTVYVIPMYADQ